MAFRRSRMRVPKRRRRVIFITPYCGGVHTNRTHTNRDIQRETGYAMPTRDAIVDIVVDTKRKHTVPMSGMFVIWHTARNAGELARAAAPYHALGIAMARGDSPLVELHHATALRLRELVTAHLRYQAGEVYLHREAIQCVAACCAYWQGRNALPCHWRQIRNLVVRFEFDLARTLFQPSRVYAVGQELARVTSIE